MTPIWGPVTSSVDWCEPNYAWSAWVAEPFNTFSSLAMVATGLYGLYRHRALPVLYRVAFALLVLVGLGSIAFHGTLKFGLQMLDELPMLYLVLVIVYILVDGGKRLAIAFAIYGAILTAMCSLTRGTVQFYTFHASFTPLELFALTKTFLLQRTGPPRVKRLFVLGNVMYTIAVIAWLADLIFCATVGPFELHAVWHVFVSLGFYILLSVIAAQKVPTEK